jgi:hypothetical protein
VPASPGACARRRPEADVVVLDEWAVDPTLPEPQGETFLILDQFEEYFIYHDAGPLHDLLPSVLERPRVHVLLALREDALARLDVFQARIPSVLSNRLRLDQLDRSAARAAIVGPLDRWNAVASGAARMAIETALVAEVLQQVESSPGIIEAPYLQLVMERVWEAEQDAGSQLLRAETLSSLGGAEAIVSAHLERALGALPPREAEIATSALKFLVTPSRTKIAQSFGDLVGYTNESPVALQQVLEILASQRILRAVAEGGDDGSRYEIFHDVLAEPVLVWRREYEARAALAAATRRHRRLAVVAAAAVLLAAAMVVLTVFAFAQQHEATKQKHAAQAQQELALGQKRLAQRQRLVAEAATRTALEQTQAANQAKAEADESATACAGKRRARAGEGATGQGEREARAVERGAGAGESGQAEESATEAKASASEAQKSKALALKERAVAERQARRARHEALLSKVGQLVASSAAKLTVDPVQSVQAALDAAKLESSTARVEDALVQLAPGAVGARHPRRRRRCARLGGVQPRRLARRNRRGRRRRPRLPQLEPRARPHAEGRLGSRQGRVQSRRPAARGGDRSPQDAARRRCKRPVQHVLPHGGAVLDLAYAGAGRYLVTASADQSTRIWDPSSGDLLHTIAGTGAQQTIAVAPSGSLFAVGTTGQPKARIFDVASGNQVGTVQQPGEVTDLAFSPNGSYLVTTGRRNGFVWETQSCGLLHVLSGHEAPITDVAFASDGRVLTGSVDSSGASLGPGDRGGALHPQRAAPAEGPRGRLQPRRPSDRDDERRPDDSRLELAARLDAARARRAYRLRDRRGIQPRRLAPADGERRRNGSALGNRGAFTQAARHAPGRRSTRSRSIPRGSSC